MKEKAIKIVEGYMRILKDSREKAIERGINYCNHKAKKYWRKEDYWNGVKNEIQKL